MNHFAANLRHFPLENIDFTSILAVFPGKVNQISTNLRHFPGLHSNTMATHATLREYCSYRYSSSALLGKAFHVILEQSVHGYF